MYAAEVDYYAVLGVNRDATTAEIRKAYKMLALSHHPDKVPEHERSSAEEKFKEISEAYEILSDEIERSNYDAFGKAGGDNYYGRYDNTSREYAAEDFARFFGFNNAEYSTSGANMRGEQKTQARTDDATIELDVSLEDIYKGKTIKMNSERDVLCKHCSGTGARKNRYVTCKICSGAGSTKQRTIYGMQAMACKKCKGRGIIVKDNCKRCSGNGTVSQASILEIYIPKGAKNHQVITLQGMSDEAYGKKTGDINFVINIEEHRVFTRRDNDLLAHATITLAEALTGFSRVLIQHLDGRGIKVTVPKGTVTKPGDCLKVSRDGMPLQNLDINGDLYLICDVEFPESGWCLETSDLTTLTNILPNKPRNKSEISPKDIDEVDYINVKELPEKFVHPEGFNEEDDEYREDGAVPECAQM